MDKKDLGLIFNVHLKIVGELSCVNVAPEINNDIDK
jgi:hypothetical protein